MDRYGPSGWIVYRRADSWSWSCSSSRCCRGGGGRGGRVWKGYRSLRGNPKRLLLQRPAVSDCSLMIQPVVAESPPKHLPKARLGVGILWSNVSTCKKSARICPMKLYTRGGTSMGTVEFLVCPLSAQVCASCSVHSQQIQAMLTRIACYLYQSLCDELRNFPNWQFAMLP